MKLREWKKKSQDSAALKGIPQSEALQAIDTLLMSVCHLSLEALYIHPDRPLSFDELTRLSRLWRRFCAEEPLPYLVGVAHFWSHQIQVSPEVLVPRADSECLVEAVLKVARYHVQSLKLSFLELGVGSGALSLAIAAEWPEAQVVGIERSERALKVAQRNQRALQRTNVEFFQGDWWAEPIFSNPHLSKTSQYHIIFSNPPYLCSEEPIPKGLFYEPKEALFSPGNGYADLLQIVALAPKLLCPNGWLLLEHGYQQGARVQATLQSTGYKNIQTLRDLKDQERVTFGQYSR